MNLKTHTLTLYSEVVKFVKLVLKDIPEEKMNEKIGEGEKPADILFHMIATPHWWMKQIGRPMDFRAKFSSLQEAIDLLDKQVVSFTELLGKEDELKWTSTDSFPGKERSLPWVMIRSANHMMHHASMLIYIRHIWGLPGLGKTNWGKIVDLAADINYS